MKNILRNKTFLNQFSTLRGKKQVGFIGLGNMGSGMVRNLHKADFDVLAFDVIPETRKLFRGEGLKVVESIEELTQHKEIDQIILMVPAAKHVASLCTGESGIFNTAKKGLQVIDCSTIGVAAAVDMYSQGKEAGVQFVDAPVSGGILAAAGGTLTFMVGSETEEQFQEVQSTLKPMAKNVFNCGKPSGGQITKAVNNMALGIQMVSIAEALSLGKKLGMDPTILSQIMGTASSACWSLNQYNPCPGVMQGVPASRHYDGGFQCQLMLKDLNLALESAKSVDGSIPLGKHTLEIYQKLVDSGLALKDFGVVYEQILNNKV